MRDGIVKIKVLFAASEAVPYIKTGGLADVAGALPGCIDRDSFDVRVIIPAYSCMDPELKKGAEKLMDFTFGFSGRECYAGILKSEFRGITFYLVDNEDYFKADRPYLGGEWDVERFLFFDEAVLEAMPRIGFRPDIIHCNDWQTGYIPVYLKERYGKCGSKQDNTGYYEHTRSLITIHNLKFQGIGSMELFKQLTGFDDSLFIPEKLEAYGCGNMLKSGIAYADRITTVSSTYAREIRTPEYGEGLDGLLNYRSDVLSGIVNGIDTSVYDPSSDKNISCRYDTDSFKAGKAKNKAFLQEQLGLTKDPSRMLVGIVSRLTDQKGMDITGLALDTLLGDGIQLAVLGNGDREYEEMFTDRAAAHPGQVAAYTSYSEKLAHRIYAGADVLSMPSRFEPCGLSQLIALAYGTLPIVRETGGLKDTVEPYNEYEDKGTGFSFTHYDAGELINAVRYAGRTFEDNRPAWDRMVKRAMLKDNSWKASAGRYEKLYRGMI